MSRSGALQVNTSSILNICDASDDSSNPLVAGEGEAAASDGTLRAVIGAGDALIFTHVTFVDRWVLTIFVKSRNTECRHVYPYSQMYR